MVYNFSSFSLLPGVCIGCQGLSARELDLCQTCEQALPHNIHCCEHCALPLPQSAPSCGRCQTETSHFDIAVSAFRYEDAIADYIQAFKYHRKLAHGRVLSELLAARIQQQYTHCELPDMLIPVPLHWQNLIFRGYNQAYEIARSLSGKLAIPVNQSTLKRHQRGRKQVSLNRKQRLSALKTCFSVSQATQVLDKHIALVDDVMTTGATASTLATLLKQAGCNKVDIWTLARTPLK